jgi:hypothetical protein
VTLDRQVHHRHDQALDEYHSQDNGTQSVSRTIHSVPNSEWTTQVLRLL